MSKTLNIRVFNTSCKDRKIFHEAGAGNFWFTPDMGLLPSLAQCFTTCEGDYKKPILSFYALPYRKKFGLGGLPILRITRPLLVDNEWDPLMVDVFLESIRLLARRLNILIAEIEIYSKVEAPIFFPSSNSAVDICNNPLLNTFLIKKGLQSSSIIPTFQTNKETNLPDFSMPENLEIRPIYNNDFKDRQSYHRLWFESGYMPIYFTKKQKDKWLDLRPWYGDVCAKLDYKDYIFIAELNGNPVGFVHWWPNLYRYFLSNKDSGSDMEIKELIKSIGEAKVFKLAVSRQVEQVSEKIKKALVYHAMKIMFSDYSIKRFQFSAIRKAEQSRLFENIDARLVHEISYFTFRI